MSHRALLYVIMPGVLALSAPTIGQTIEYCTFLGGSGSDDFQQMQMDPSGDYVLIVGNTGSNDFPFTHGDLGHTGNFAAKIPLGGGPPAWARGFGPGFRDGSAVDAAGNFYVSGTTSDLNFPTTDGTFVVPCGNPQQSFCGWGRYVVKFSPDGERLFSTIVGYGNGNMLWGTGLAVDAAGQYVYMSGSTDDPASTSLVTESFPNFQGVMDVCVSRFTDTGTSLVLDRGVFLGGADWERSTALALDEVNGHVWVAGKTRSTDFPITPGAFHSTHGADELVFLARLDATSLQKDYCSLVAATEALAVAVDGSGLAYVTGVTESASGLAHATNYFDNTLGGGSDAYLIVVDATGSASTSLVYGTYLGGSDWERGLSIALDGVGRATVSMETASSDMDTTTGAYQANANGQNSEAFIARVDLTESGLPALDLGTYFGGNRREPRACVRLDGQGRIVLGLQSESKNGWNPTVHSLIPPDDGSFDGNSEVVIARFLPTEPPPAVPVAPSGLAASAASTSQIDLAWTDNAGDEDGFEIQRSPDGSNWILLATLGPNVIFHPDDGLGPNATWHYRVRAFNGYGDSNWSNLASATTFPAAAPLAPSNLSATAISATQIDLAWTDNATDESSFQIERSLAGAGSWSPIASPGADATTFADTGLSPETGYDYRVKAVNVVGSSAWSNVASATTPAVQATDVTANADLPVSGTVTGSYLDTHAPDGVHEEIREVQTGGKPSKRRSYLEHTWAFDVPAGATATFNVEAWHTANSEGDDFAFSWSTDGVIYTPMLTVIKTTDDGTVQDFLFPTPPVGTVYVRVKDTDPTTQGNSSLDTLFVDHMYIRVE